jgi:hypothetical protein
MLRAALTRDVSEPDDAALALEIELLRRRIAWQVEAAYNPQPEPEQEPVVAAPLPPEPAPAPTRLPKRSRIPSLSELERLVAREINAHPDRADEWRWYLFYLRDFATVDGELPESFALLVRIAFAAILPSGSAEPVEVCV